MKRNALNAFRALSALNAPVINHCQNGEDKGETQWGAEFILSAELRDSEDSLFADYYAEEISETIDETAAADESHVWRTADGHVIRNAFGIREDVHKILRANSLFAEWIDGGTLGIYQD